MKLNITIRFKYWQVAIGWGCVTLAAIIFYLTAGAVDRAEFEANHWDMSWGMTINSFFYTVTFFFFLLNYYYHLIKENKSILSYFEVTVLVTLIGTVYLIIIFYLFPGARRANHDTIQNMVMDTVGTSIPAFIISFLIAYFTVVRESLKQKRVLEGQKLMLESQINQSNYSFLKAQINPHFLYNTLNFLYSRSLPYTRELSGGILALSDVMRYALSQENHQNGKVPLKDEVNHVRNVINLYQLPNDNQLKVNFEVKGDLTGVYIIPYVLIAIAENAFKHGDLKNEVHPIDIKLQVEGRWLYFYCRNRKLNGLKRLSAGVGLDNIKSRLADTYGDHFKLEIKEERDFYTAELTIDKL